MSVFGLAFGHGVGGPFSPTLRILRAQWSRWDFDRFAEVDDGRGFRGENLAASPVGDVASGCLTSYRRSDDAGGSVDTGVSGELR